MITHISGNVSKKKELSVVVDVNGFSYEVFIPAAIMKILDEKVEENSELKLITYHYHQVDQSRAIPILISFLNEIEREFFEKFITVSGIGPKAAVRALSLPFSRIADGIDSGDLTLLKTLPGIGEQRAKEIIAKLQGKVGKFGLIQDKETAVASDVKEDVRNEAMEVLLQLQYKKKEAEMMVHRAITTNPKLSTCEDILNEVYKQKSKR